MYDGYFDDVLHLVELSGTSGRRDMRVLLQI